MSIPYDLLDVIWGDEILRARPIKWNKDLTADDVDPEEIDDVYVTMYELACPNCGGRCNFSIFDTKIMCEGCGSITTNPVEKQDAEKNDEDGNEEDNVDDELIDDENLIEDIEKAKEDLVKSNKPQTPEDILDNLTASITNTEILLDPDEDDMKEVEESKKSTKSKTSKKKPKKKAKKEK